MFTGIIEEIGTVKSIIKGAKSAQLAIKAHHIFTDLKLGDSVAVNGVCLTVSKLNGDIFEADTMAETLNRTDLGTLKPGSKVNLERAMSVNDRFGGHIVSGHIDGTGTITETKPNNNAVEITISSAKKITRYIVEKGSVTIDGISLTVVKVWEDHFQVSVIPHTGKSTTLLSKSVGSTVNLENDIIGKYIERFCTVIDPSKQESITMQFLKQSGF